MICIFLLLNGQSSPFAWPIHFVYGLHIITYYTVNLNFCNEPRLGGDKHWILGDGLYVGNNNIRIYLETSYMITELILYVPLFTCSDTRVSPDLWISLVVPWIDLVILTTD
jgi:hypothetical protein